MERASRLIVLGSIALAAIAHAWLAQSHAALGPVALAAFATTYGLAKLSRPTALAIVAGTAYVAPALLTAMFGVADYHVILVWLAAAAGPIFAAHALEGWHFPGRWRLPLAAWALVIAVTWPIVAGRELDFSAVVAHSYGVANGIALISPPLAAAFIIAIALTQMIGILWLDLLCAHFRAADHRAFARTVAMPFVVGAALSAVVGIYQRLFDLTFLNPPIWINLNRAGGLLNDANTFGAGAAIWGPVAIAAAWSASRRPWTGAAFYALLAAGMWSSGSRTALLAFGAGTAAVLIGLLQRRGLWEPRFGRIAALLGVAVFILAAAVVPRDFESGNPFKRAFDRVPQLNATEIRRFVVEDLWIRFGYGQAAVDIIRDHPIAGVGVGAFHLVAPEYIYRDSGRAIEPDNAQNWWRHQVAELGLLGALPAIGASVLLITLLRGSAVRGPVGAATVLRGSVIGIGIASLFGVPTQHPATFLSFTSIVFWLIAMAEPPVNTADGPPRWAWVAVLAGVATVAIALVASAKADLHPRTRAMETPSPYAHGLSRSEGISAYGDFRWAATDVVSTERVGNRWLQLTMWAPYRNVAERDITVNVRVNGRDLLTHHFNSADAETFYLRMPPGAAWATLEMSISGAVPRYRAIQTAIRFVGAPAPNVAAERVRQ